MLDAFFQELRKIQRRETNESGLARVGWDFYPKVHSYISMLRDKVESNPFADEEHRLLKNTQIIATDICARREHKIADTAVNNIQRSYRLFQGKKPQFDSEDTTPLNLTPEEEQLYFSLMDTVRSHRTRLLPSLNLMDDEQKTHKSTQDIPPVNNQAHLFEPQETEPIVDIFDEKEEIAVSNDSVQSDSPKIQSEVIPKSENKPVTQERVQVSKKIDETQSVNHGADDLSKDIYASIYADEEFVDLPPEVPLKPYEINKSSKKDFNPDKISFKTLVVFDEVPSIMGVDEKVYGPFYPQDVVKMPELNADLFRKRHKGRFVKI